MARTAPARKRDARPSAAPPRRSRPLAATEPARPPRPRREGARLPEETGVLLQRGATDDFELLDTGNGRKLERYGALTLDRPEAQALWAPAMAEWRADATFTGDVEEEGAGRWQFRDPAQSGTWPLAWDGVRYHGRFTAFRHVGVFPEQAPHWSLMRDLLADRPGARVLNLFGYTGLASLAAADAGAQVTHVDASRKAIGWARENAELAGLAGAPIRWICDDAVRFCEREVRRGRAYDVVLVDPPAFGRGPKGETWRFFEDVPHLLDLVRAVQSDRPLLTVVTSYAIRASHLAVHELMQDCFAGMEGRLQSGEACLRDRAGRALSTSMFTRFVGAAA